MRSWRGVQKTMNFLQQEQGRIGKQSRVGVAEFFWSAKSPPPLHLSLQFFTEKFRENSGYPSFVFIYKETARLFRKIAFFECLCTPCHDCIIWRDYCFLNPASGEGWGDFIENIRIFSMGGLKSNWRGAKETWEGGGIASPGKRQLKLPLFSPCSL